MSSAIEQMQATIAALQAQLQAQNAKIGTMEQAEKARTASVYVSRNNNLTISWKKQGVFRSWAQPTKSVDGKTWLRGGFIPATYSLGNGFLSISAQLPVDADEAKVFTEKFILQNVVESATPVKTGTTQAPVAPTATMPMPIAPVAIAPIPVTAQVSSDQLVKEAQDLVNAGLYPSLMEAVASVKKARGIK